MRIPLLGLLLIFACPYAGAITAASYLDINLRQNQYFGNKASPSQDNGYTLLRTDLNLETESEGFSYKLNPVAQGDFNNRDEFYFGVPEMYVAPRKIAPWFSLTIGRAKRSWSRLDEEFNLGIWQPQLRWDYLAPVQQGLTGVFFDWSLSSQLRFTFFTSPLSLPDQGPQYHLTNGRFTSSNRWFDPPHSQLSFQGQSFAKDAPLFFEIDKPSEEDIIMHSSFGLGVHYEYNSALWTNVNYAYKPRNQIHLGIECSNCVLVGGSPGLEITALIHPIIVKHHVLTIETGFDRVDDRGWLSFTADVPNRSGFPSDWQESALNPTIVVGASYQHYLREWIGKPSWLQYSYMRVFEIERSSSDGLVGDQVKSSLDRYPYKELATIDWRIQLSSRKSRSFSLRNRYSYSVPERGGWLSSSAELVMNRLTYTLGMDILGADVDSNSSQAGLFSTYRANDRFIGGVSYVF